MLNAIKGTISNVKEDVAHSFQSLASAKSTHAVPKLAHAPSPEHVKGFIDVNTGAELLHRYSEAWKSIHENSEDVSRRAAEVDRVVGYIHQSMEKQNSTMNHFLSELSAMSHLLSAITNVQEHLGKLETEFSTLEKQLVELEDVCEQQDMRVQRSYHDSQLLLHQKRKHQELEHTKATLASKHHKKVQEMEQHMVKTLHERQLVFANAHLEQMQNYKQFGQIEGRHVEERIGRPAGEDYEDIGNIVIEENIHELERFLEDLGISEEKSDCGDEADMESSQLQAHDTNPTTLLGLTGSERGFDLEKTSTDLNAQATYVVVADAQTSAAATTAGITDMSATTGHNDIQSAAVFSQATAAELKAADTADTQAAAADTQAAAADTQAAAAADTKAAAAADTQAAAADTQAAAAADTQAAAADTQAAAAADTQAAAADTQAAAADMQAAVTDSQADTTGVQAAIFSDNLEKQTGTNSNPLTVIPDDVENRLTSGEVKEQNCEPAKQRDEEVTVLELSNNKTNDESINNRTLISVNHEISAEQQNSDISES